MTILHARIKEAIGTFVLGSDGRTHRRGYAFLAATVAFGFTTCAFAAPAKTVVPAEQTVSSRPLDIALVNAGRNADIASAKILLNDGADINAIADGSTALSGATLNGNFTLMAYLLSRGANPNVFAPNSPTPLTNAIESDNADVVRALIAAGANVNLGGGLGETPLMRAALNGNNPIAQILLAKGAAVDEPNDLGESPLFGASAAGNIDTVRLLIAHKANVNSVAQSGYTPLIAAVSAGQTSCVKLLLANGANPNAVNGVSETPLIIAITKSDPWTVQTLIAAKANVEQFDAHANTPLMLASARGGSAKGFGIAKALLLAGAHPNPVNDDGQTALMYACGYHAAATAIALLAHHADPTSADRYGETALLYLAGVPSAQLGANVTPITPLPRELKLEHLLASRLAVGSNDDPMLATAMQVAAATGRIDVVDGLLDAGVPVDAPVTDQGAIIIESAFRQQAASSPLVGLTPLQLAQLTHQTAVVAALSRYTPEPTSTAATISVPTVASAPPIASLSAPLTGPAASPSPSPPVAPTPTTAPAPPTFVPSPRSQSASPPIAPKHDPTAVQVDPSTPDL